MAEITPTEERLWELLDNISTLYDVYKGRDRSDDPLYRAILIECGKRNLYLHSPDGYGLKRTSERQRREWSTHGRCG